MSGAFLEMLADEIGRVPPFVLRVNVSLTGSPRLRNEGNFIQLNVDQTLCLRVGIWCNLNIGYRRETAKGGIRYSRIISLCNRPLQLK